MKLRNSILTLAVMLFSFQSLLALGTYSEGRAIVKVIKMESQGIFINSFEGEFEVASYDKSEQCDMEDGTCYTPQKKTVKFSIDNDNKEVAQFLIENMNRVMLIDYKIHRIEPVSLKTSFEVLGAKPLLNKQPENFVRRKNVSKTGGAGNVSIYGKVLKLEYRGTMVGTYEALVYNRQKDKILPVSITNEAMAAYVKEAMNSSQEYYIGLSTAVVSGLRESDIDIFEINYDKPADLAGD
ncbi:MAG TPA: hypothetical protein DEA96_10115 [Leptospiraceae bacterium]|nr:hypothetical protein [Spirochaetaceae bacterium]HBS05311.1 hypothetical protein [Leptospiraceae bacterium]|tara:strand:- start:26469 stop:27185 length:717 start_codon:yes stop_codon:yes gene_type:complete